MKFYQRPTSMQLLSSWFSERCSENSSFKSGKNILVLNLLHWHLNLLIFRLAAGNNPMDLDSWYVISKPTIMKVIIRKFSDTQLINHQHSPKLKIGARQSFFITISDKFKSVTNKQYKCIYIKQFCLWLLKKLHYLTVQLLDFLNHFSVQEMCLLARDQKFRLLSL